MWSTKDVVIDNCTFRDLGGDDTNFVGCSNVTLDGKVLFPTESTEISATCQVLSYYLHYIKTKGIGVFLVAGRQKILTIMPLDTKALSHTPMREALRSTIRAIKVSSLSRTVLPLSQPCSPTRRHRQPDGREGRQHLRQRIPQGCLSSVWPPR